MNPADGPVASSNFFAGNQRNTFPMYGSGHVVYSQFGYLLPKGLFGKSGGTLMPYALSKQQTMTGLINR